MTKYVKFISNTQIQFAPKNKGSILNYDLDIEAMTVDGYKPFVPALTPVTNRMYHIEYVENIDNIAEIIFYDETQEEADLRELNDRKQEKIDENDAVRDVALNQGVVYKEVLFDSDTDQKVNLLAIVMTMNDEDEITWFGKDNQPLLCDKQDLINIGGLITVLHNHCWTLNASIKGAISEAQTVEEVEAIEIDYTIESEVTNEN